MFKRLVFSALAAGVLAGVFMWGLQMVSTVPLIAQAEIFEVTGSHEHNHDEAEAAFAPEDGFQRHAFTLLAAVLLGVGFSFMLVAIFALRGAEVDARQGLLWGIGGYAAFYLSPAFGLPPELPGMMAADLDARQMWWAFAAVSAAFGLGMCVFAENKLWKIAGALIVSVPHVVGAPHVMIDDMGGGPPAELAAQFVTASLVTMAVFWAVLGMLSGYFYARFDDD